MANAALALGSNLGNRLSVLHKAVAALKTHFPIKAISPIYETAPLYVTDQPAFLNMALLIESDLSPRALLRHLKELEQKIGRTPSIRFGPRLIDIDILFIDDLVFEEEDLILPHPRMAERRFVLAPLADIAPDWPHPQTGLTISQMLKALPAKDEIKLFEAVDAL